MSGPTDNLTVVLDHPQDNINIGNVARACKNFCVDAIRLVEPAEFDPDEIEVTARRARDVVDAMEIYESLPEALSDCKFVVGTTARPRSAPRIVTEPRGAAAKAVEIGKEHRVAYLFGREDKGLSNAALDRCHSIVTIPTNPDYTSLNLGQAVLLNIWEYFRIARDIDTVEPDLGIARPDSEFPPASSKGMERLMERIDTALEEIEFFKTETSEHVLRAVRNVLNRAALDERELAIWHGIFREVSMHVDRLHDRLGGED